MSIRKISNKKLSRNLKTKNAPLRVLPLAPLPIRHPVKQNQKKQLIEETSLRVRSLSTLQHVVVKVLTRTRKTLIKPGRRGPITMKPFLRFHFAMNTFRWILLLIGLYLAAGTAVMMIQQGTESLKNIVIYSIMGFFTFFMGYLGWILARDVLLMVSSRKTTRNEIDVET